MNAKLVKALIFTAGAAIGSAVTYYILQQRHEKEKQDIIDSYEQEFREMSKAAGNDIPDETVPADSEDATKVKPEMNINYGGYFKPDSDGPLMNTVLAQHENYEEEGVKLTNMAQAYVDGTMTPVMVTQAEFESGERRDLERVSVLYYIDDDYICTADDETETRPDLFMAIGLENLEVFRLSDAEVIWVLNQKTGCIYEVEVFHGPCPIND